MTLNSFLRYLSSVFWFSLFLRCVLLGLILGFFPLLSHQEYFQLSDVFLDIGYFIFYSSFFIPFVDGIAIILLTWHEKQTLKLWGTRLAMFLTAIFQNLFLAGIFLLLAKLA